ncbi:MAG TPA: S41 family peptidase [Bacteroidota bacterium]|nr:S41 family peptidase [Bacteroidota bacterium]
MVRRLSILFFLLFPALLTADSPQGYYRFPALSSDKIFFTAEGDLWKVDLSGGLAQRLTTHPGSETNASVSPDGRLVAFSAQYEGPTEVYTMPVEGGLPTRRTYDGDAVVVGWTPDGKIIYQSSHYSTSPNRQLLTVDIRSGATDVLPLSQASDGSFDAKGTSLYFTRLPFQGSHTKRYKGGTAQNIWKYESGKPEASPLTPDYPGTSKTPMWWNGRIYFASDRDGTMNLWSMDEQGKDLKQLTSHKGWDVKSPSLRDGRIAYQLGADIHVYDIAAGADRLVSITLSSDFDQERERWVKKPMDYLSSSSLSPTGDRVALASRGQVFVAPAEQGRLTQASVKPTVRYYSAEFMPDGKSLLVLTDESGELEFWKVAANGIGEPEQLTRDGKVYKFDGVVSPDGKWLAYTDKDNNFWLLNIAEKKLTKIASNDVGGYSGFSWSPDSKWLAYNEDARNSSAQIKLCHITDGAIVVVTRDRVDSYNPVWSTDGKWLYFLSDRYFQSLVGSPWGARQPEPFFDKTTKLYSLSLRKDGRSPFLPSDELVAAQQEEKDKEKDKGTEKKKEGEDQKKDKATEVVVDIDGIQDRVTEVPVPAGRYGDLTVNDKYLFWTDVDVSANAKSKLVALEIKNKDIAAKTVLEDVNGYELSKNGKKILVRKGGDFYVIDAGSSAPSELSKNKVNLDGWIMSVDPKQEWRKMLVEAWRMERDFFYDPNLHGIDYKGLLDRHLSIVDRVTDRDELNDLISSLVGELASLHIFVGGGDRRLPPDQISAASLGAVLVRDETNGGYTIQHIYRSEPDYPEVSSPLSKPELKIQEKDVIRSINGVPILSVASPSLLLRNKAGQQVLLQLKSAGNGKEYEAIVKPMTQGEESNLRYSEWEYTRRLRVEDEGKGDIGYVHLRAMGGGNYTEWVKNFYPVFDRKGLVIDMRYNRGGNIDSWILEKLMRKAWFYFKNRNNQPTWNMQYAFRGHLVVLCNEYTASDGEAFTEGFRRLGLGKVIGTRTWGGEIWLSARPWLEDRGMATAAESGVYGPEGEWLIEGHGVDPDMVVDDMPHESFGGKDAQLDAAVQYLQEQIKLHPVEVPPAPKFPVKAFDYRK